jgi:putative membrane protein
MRMYPNTNRLRWKVLSLLGLSLGLGVVIWLVSAASLTAVVQSFVRIGWGALAVVAVRAVMIVTNGAAWARLLNQLTSVPTRVFLLARWIREAVDVLLPVAYVGGGLIGARILTLWRMPGRMGVASAAVDLFLQLIAQALFAAFGAALLMRLIGTRNVLPDAILGIAAAIIALGGFYIVQRHGGARVIDRLFVLLSWRVTSQAQTAELGFQRSMDAIWNGRRFDILIALLVHVLAWTFGTLEVWFALHFMEWPVTLEQAVILESLGASISIAGFFIPGSLGIQEAGYVLIGHVLGLPVQLSLSLSLVKRIPDLVLGLPGLLTWHTLETRHLLLPKGDGVAGKQWKLRWRRK